MSATSLITTVTVRVNQGSTQIFNVKSWEQWQSEVGDWVLSHFPNSTLVSLTNPWLEINAENYKLHPQLALIDVPRDFGGPDGLTSSNKPPVKMIFSNLKHLIRQPLPTIIRDFRNKIYVDNLNKEVNYLVNSPDISNMSEITIVSGLVDVLEKIYGRNVFSTTVLDQNETNRVKEVCNRWIVDLTSVTSDLPHQLQVRIKLLFHQVFDSIMNSVD